ncbi:hypothetical protein CBP36_21430 (plasmid) [Acidovorax carolinensis]|uniref:DUF5710 domain-containing protein n=2 Tax=Acidovorax carolinensis TaxID=553814 RepID=A0A240UJ76_9BURK|nr:hypothetical protein CBP36_21430 [Acidovorax carolinensis]
MVAAEFEPGMQLLPGLVDWIAEQSFSELADHGVKAQQDLVQAISLSSLATQIELHGQQQGLQQLVEQWKHPAWQREVVNLIEEDPAAFFDAIRVSELVVAQIITQTRIAQQQLDTTREIEVARHAQAPGTDKSQAVPMHSKGQPQGDSTMENTQPAQGQSDGDRAASFAAYNDRVEAMFAERQAVLAVPFADKDRAKNLGAVWFKPQMVWFVPKGLDVAKFKEWDPRDHCLGRTAAEGEVMDSFRKAMDTMGLDSSKEIVADGKWHNVRALSKKGKNLSGAYVLDLVGGRDGTPTGSINNKHTGMSHFWTFDGPVMTPEQKARMRAEALRRAEEADKIQQQAQTTAAKHAAEIVAAGMPASGHGYVQKKGISAEGCVQVPGKVLLNYDEFLGESGRTAIREDQNYLIIPMRNAEGEIRAVQAISEDGSVKSFMRGAQKKGTVAVLGAASLKALCEQAAASAQHVHVANFVEGFATGASYRHATGLPVVVCFDAGNLEAVAAEAAATIPENLVPVIAVDNDQFHIERALGYLAKTLGVNPNSQRGSVVEVLSGKDSVRMVALGDAVADGEWHQAPKGRYRMSLERESESTEVRSITVEATLQDEQRTERLLFSNRGLEAGKTALEAFGERAVVVVPEFKQLAGRPTDWNDMAAMHGETEIARQVRTALAISPLLAAQRQQEQPSRAPQRASSGLQR